MHTIVCRANMRGTRSVISTFDSDNFMRNTLTQLFGNRLKIVGLYAGTIILALVLTGLLSGESDVWISPGFITLFPCGVVFAVTLGSADPFGLGYWLVIVFYCLTAVTGTILKSRIMYLIFTFALAINMGGCTLMWMDYEQEEMKRVEHIGAP